MKAMHFPWHYATGQVSVKSGLSDDMPLVYITHANITTAAKRQNIKTTDTISKSTFDSRILMILIFYL